MVRETFDLTFSMFFLRTTIVLGVLLALSQQAVRCADFVLEDSSSRIFESDSGVVNLEWVAAGDKPETIFELEKSTRSDFSASELIYKGPDHSRHLTGLREGEYYFRIREPSQAGWSEPLRVNIHYISRGKLFTLLGVGFVVCLLTVIAIIQGHMGRRAG